MPHPVRRSLRLPPQRLFSPCAATAVGPDRWPHLLQGKAAFGDWHADSPGTRRLIRPQDLPAPEPAASARNFVRKCRAHRQQKPIVPNGFEVNLFASGLDLEPRLIRVAPNGDVFVAESAAGRIRVLRPNGSGAAAGDVFRRGPR